MALLINKTTNIYGDISIPNIYIRLGSSVDLIGDTININMKLYSSKSSYLSSSINNSIKVDGIDDEEILLSYNRELNGSDIIGYAHDHVMEKLSVGDVSRLPARDPSTWEIIYLDNGDPSIITTITGEHFCEPNEISIVDLD